LGKTPKVLAVIMCLSLAGIWIDSMRRSGPQYPPGTTVLRMWTFGRVHYAAYKEVLPQFEASHPGVKVELELVHLQAVSSRLQAAFWANLDVPDLVETEINSVGMFFRGPIEDIGFLDLTDRIHEEGIWDRTVHSRFAPWSSRGRIFGLPHDVHPVGIAYRRDLFEEAGIEAEQLTTWDRFIEAGHKITRDLDGDGTKDRYMLELSDNTPEFFNTLMFQRGGNFFDVEGHLLMDSEQVLETLLFYVPLVTGPDKIATTLGEGQIFTQALEQGYLASILCPDWRSRRLELDIPRLEGKMGLMPLPAVEPGGRRTSTWGGTMLGITKASEHPDLSWELALFLYYSVEPFNKRFWDTNIIPPVKDAWTLPAISKPKTFWDGQAVGNFYVGLAPETPPQFTHPFTPVAFSKMGEVLNLCVGYYAQKGESGFRPFAREVLSKKADELRELMEMNPYQ
jgi:arabinosaccharide transport system substrate-binding protein